jgi:hypothetical protein
MPEMFASVSSQMRENSRKGHHLKISETCRITRRTSLRFQEMFFVGEVLPLFPSLLNFFTIWLEGLPRAVSRCGRTAYWETSPRKLPIYRMPEIAFRRLRPASTEVRGQSAVSQGEVALDRLVGMPSRRSRATSHVRILR